jgi:pyruvate/2-oxoglutarate dehydrogenase complex dihydrolipoamide dehydrogenase (E3) component
MAASVDPDRRDWDVIVIGGGAVGENAAQYASQYSGLEAVIVENELLGGECSYWACIPSKTLLRPGETYGRTGAACGPAQGMPVPGSAVRASHCSGGRRQTSFAAS